MSGTERVSAAVAARLAGELTRRGRTRRVLVGPGGPSNPALVRALRAAVPHVEVTCVESDRRRGRSLRSLGARVVAAGFADYALARDPAAAEDGVLLSAFCGAPVEVWTAQVGSAMTMLGPGATLVALVPEPTSPGGGAGLATGLARGLEVWHGRWEPLRCGTGWAGLVVVLRPSGPSPSTDDPMPMPMPMPMLPGVEDLATRGPVR